MVSFRRLGENMTRAAALGWLAVAIASTLGAVAAVGCSAGAGGGSSGQGGSGGSGGMMTSSSSGMGGENGGAGGGNGGAGGTMGATAEIVVQFDPLGQLAEGLVIDGTTAYVSLSVIREVWKVDLLTNTASPWATVPGTLGTGFTQGLAMDAQKNVLVAMQSLDPAQTQPGIYKIPPAGGTATLLGKAPGLNYPRSITKAPFGPYYITVPDPGRVFTMTAQGGMTEVPVAPNNTAFGYDPASACLYGMAQPMGITSMVVQGQSAEAGDYYWVNADRASFFAGFFDPGNGILAEISPAFHGPDCADTGGGEGLIEDPMDGTLLYAARQSNALVRTKLDGTTTVLAKGKPIDAPSAIAIATIQGKRYLYFTNSAYVTYKQGGIPSLGRIPL